MQLFRMRRAGWLCTGSRNVTLSMATTASPSTDPVMNLTPGDDRRKAHAVTSSRLCAVRRIEPCGGAACGLALLPLTFARFVAKLLIGHLMFPHAASCVVIVTGSGAAGAGSEAQHSKSSGNRSRSLCASCFTSSMVCGLRSLKVALPGVSDKAIAGRACSPWHARFSCFGYRWSFGQFREFGDLL